MPVAVAADILLVGAVHGRVGGAVNLADGPAIETGFDNRVVDSQRRRVTRIRSRGARAVDVADRANAAVAEAGADIALATNTSRGSAGAGANAVGGSGGAGNGPDRAGRVAGLDAHRGDSTGGRITVIRISVGSRRAGYRSNRANSAVAEAGFQRIAAWEREPVRMCVCPGTGNTGRRSPGFAVGRSGAADITDRAFGVSRSNR